MVLLFFSADAFTLPQVGIPKSRSLSTIIKHLAEDDSQVEVLEAVSDAREAVPPLAPSHEDRKQRQGIIYDPISILLAAGILTLFADDVFHFMPEGGLVSSLTSIADKGN